MRFQRSYGKIKRDGLDGHHSEEIGFDVFGDFKQREVRQNHFDKIMNEASSAKSMLQRALLSAALVLGMSFGGPMIGPAYAEQAQYPLKGEPEIMAKKEHGTCPAPVQGNLRFGADQKTADNISCYNRDWAEFAGYAFQKDKTWTKDVLLSSNE